MFISYRDHTISYKANACPIKILNWRYITTCIRRSRAKLPHAKKMYNGLVNVLRHCNHQCKGISGILL